MGVISHPNRSILGDCHHDPDVIPPPPQLTINVTDENDNRPIFTEDGYTAVVAENAPMGTEVITVSATDADQAESGMVRYRIVDAGTAEGEDGYERGCKWSVKV